MDCATASPSNVQCGPPHEKLERLVDLMAPHDGPTSYIGDAYDLASELLASREAGQ